MMTHRCLTEEDKREICAWKYGGEYAVYDLPPYEAMRQAGLGFADPGKAKQYLGFWRGDALIGFVNILEEAAEVFIGLGVRPDCCGKGYGCEILREAYRIAKARYPAKPLYLEVRTWNRRAIRCYEKAGFAIDGEPYELTTLSGKGLFYRMTKN
ncbi:MAG: GNAT family N-acetyltransferase [Oscillospiraceae bacterium]